MEDHKTRPDKLERIDPAGTDAHVVLEERTGAVDCWHVRYLDRNGRWRTVTRQMIGDTDADDAHAPAPFMMKERAERTALAIRETGQANPTYYPDDETVDEIEMRSGRTVEVYEDSDTQSGKNWRFTPGDA